MMRLKWVIRMDSCSMADALRRDEESGTQGWPWADTESPSASQGERPQKKLTQLTPHVQFRDSRLGWNKFLLSGHPECSTMLTSVLANTASLDPHLGFVVWVPGSFVCPEVTVKREHLRPSPVLVETRIFCLSTADSPGCRALLSGISTHILHRSLVTGCAVSTWNCTGARGL